MLNGKFYTGLTPKMMERNAGTTGTPNRLESHLFWPDDTHVETVQENRSRRRSSLQTEAPRAVTTYQRQSSWTGNAVGGAGENGVDTKQRFQKEFAKSSIQFCDNIPEENFESRNAYRPQARRHLKQDITTKPTAVKMQLPNNETAHDEYAAIKKKQAFSSKIQFYDYVDDAAERRNNQIKRKMDMNDKKDVERHTKNSPKLQVKGIARNLRMVDEQRNNERERLTPESNSERYVDIERPRSGARVIRNEVRVDGRNGNMGHQHSKLYESPTRGHTNYRNDDYEENDYAYNGGRAVPRAQSVPKKILKNPSNLENDYNEDYNDYNNELKHDLEQLERTTRNMRMRDTPKKHVSYGDDVYEYEANHDNYDDETNMHSNYREYGQGSKSTTRTPAGNGAITTHSSRNQMKTINRQTTTGRNERSRNSPTSAQAHDPHNEQQPYDEPIERSNRKSVAQTNTKNSNLFKSNDNSKLNNQHQQQPQQRRNTPKMSLSLNSATNTANDSATSPTSPTLDAQKHLRSSLCFSGGEIVANNNNNNSREGTPTSDSNSRHRTARSVATSRRICVGLPD